MAHHKIAAVMAVAGLCMWSLPAVAQAPDQPASERGTVKRAPRVTASKKIRRRRTATEPTAIAPPLFSSDGSSSLEQRRKAFFAKPDDSGTASGATPPAGITLGGSNGLTPGMGMKF